MTKKGLDSPPNAPGTRDDGPVHFHVDGAVLHRDDPGLDPSLLAVGLCYTTIRVDAGSGSWTEEHVARLGRDARSHGLPAPDADRVRHAIESLARAEFGNGEGIVRLQLGTDADGVVHLVGIPRGLGADPEVWTLGTASEIHPGPGERASAKLLGVPFIEAARKSLAASPYDEAALFDADGLLVEGTRSNLLVVLEDGTPCCPAPELGAVAGIGLQVARDRVPEISPARITGSDLDRAREIVAVNAVRGPRPIVEWNGVPVGNGRPGAFARSLTRAMSEAGPGNAT